MDEHRALLDAFRRSTDPAAASAVETLVREGADEDLARVNALAFAAANGLSEDTAIAALLHASRLGLFEMSWNILCPSCSGVLGANATLKTVRQASYHCVFCSLSEEPTLDDTVEVSFAVSPRLRAIASHEPGRLAFWDYHRQAFFGSGVALPARPAFDLIAREVMVETAELGPGEHVLLPLELPDEPVIVFDPVTHTATHVDVTGERTEETQGLALVFDAGVATVAEHTTLRPGPLRLSLDNRTRGRVLPGVFTQGEALMRLIGGRRPFLTAKRLLTNQTFRDIYRTDTIDVDQRLKILSLTFLFTDLKGSTELYDRVGDLVAYDIVRNHFRLLHDIVASESGAIVKTIGDAVMATFPTPDRAIAAALRMREAMHRLSAGHEAGELVLKIGLHEGPCLAVSLNDRQDYFGQTVNIAARVQELTQSDAIFATEAVVRHPDSARLLAARHVVSTSETRSLRGIGERRPVYELS